MPSLNGYSYIVLNGRPQPLGQTVSENTRPGDNGHRFRKEGRRADRFKMIGIRDVDDASAADDVIESQKNAQGSLVEIVDESGVSFTHVLLHSVTETERKKISGAVGGVSSGKTYLVTHEFELQLTE